MKRKGVQIFVLETQLLPASSRMRRLYSTLKTEKMVQNQPATVANKSTNSGFRLINFVYLAELDFIRDELLNNHNCLEAVYTASLSTLLLTAPGYSSS